MLITLLAPLTSAWVAHANGRPRVMRTLTSVNSRHDVSAIHGPHATSHHDVSAIHGPHAAAPAIQHRRRCPPPVAFGQYDLTLGLVSWGLIVAYQVSSDRFTAAWASQNAESRAVWARYILEKGDYILGVQTLRNALTSASFFASACFTCLSLLIGIASQRAVSGVAAVKFGVAALLLVAAALSYLQSVRYCNSCAFLFQVANDQRDETCSRGTVMLLMVLSQNCWAAGEKSLYLLVPAVVWLVGGGAVMLPFVLGFLPLLYYKDLPAPTNLLKKDEPSLEPYAYLLSGSLSFLDIFGFSTALRVAQTTVAQSGDYAKEKYGLDSATWPPKPAA